MANRSFLLTHDSAVPLVASDAADSIVAAASYQVPLLWLALFEPASLLSVDVPLEDAEGNASVGAVPTLFSPAAAAVARYWRLKPRLVAALPHGLLAHLSEWEELLPSLNGVSIQVDLAEIWMMFEAVEFDGSIRGWLAGVDGTDPEGWTSALGQANLPTSPEAQFDTAVARFGLRGYEWDRALPWKD